MLGKSWTYLNTELEAREEWNKFVFEIKAGKSPQSLAESKALGLLVMQESRPHKNPKPGTLGEQQVEASPGDPRATIWQGHEFSKIR